MTGGATAKFKRLGYKLIAKMRSKLIKPKPRVAESRRKSIMVKLAAQKIPTDREPVDLDSIVFEKW